MSRSEAESVRDAIIASIGGIFACFEGLSVEELNWRPPVAQPNTLVIIATHVLGNTTLDVLGMFGGFEVQRVREEEFAVEGDVVDQIRARWSALKVEVRAVSSAPMEIWGEEIDYFTGGRVTRREALLSVHRHASEHLGEAQMIRDLILQGRG